MPFNFLLFFNDFSVKVKVLRKEKKTNSRLVVSDERHFRTRRRFRKTRMIVSNVSGEAKKKKLEGLSGEENQFTSPINSCKDLKGRFQYYLKFFSLLIFQDCIAKEHLMDGPVGRTPRLEALQTFLVQPL